MLIVATSDLHNGTTANYDKYHKLLNIVEQMRPSLYVKIGDGQELVWQTFEHNMDWEPSRLTIEHEKRIATSICPVIEMLGNHNMNLAKFAAELYPIKVGGLYLTIDNIVYTHGHQFDPSVKYWWAPLQTAFEKFVPCIGEKLFGTPFVLKQHGKDVSYSKLVSIIEHNFQWWLQGHNGIFGHTHSEFVKQRCGQIIANSGDFYDSCSYLVIKDGKSVELKWV